MNYKHIGWCKEDNHDKVWGIIELGSLGAESDPNRYIWKLQEKFKYATFWGRRGKKLQIKVWEGYGRDSADLFMKKQDKGYKEIDQTKLDEVYPEFAEDLEKTAVWAMLTA